MNQAKLRELEKTITNDYGNTTGIVIQQNGKVLYEQYFNGYDASDPVHVASVTKGVFSALVGVAIDKGHIQSVDQKILDFFPTYVVKRDEQTLPRLTLRHMLTMTAPYKCETEPYEEFFASDDWLTFALDLLGGDDQIGEFRYSPIVGVHVLSGILVQATGQSVFDFATKHLFSPLGICVKDNVVLHNEEEHHAFFQGKQASGWVADLQGVNPAGWGLTLTPLDMAKIGQLYLNGGVWQGKQVIPAWWLDECTKEHSRWVELGLPYGYLWWILDGEKPVYAALGDGGNVIYVNTEKKLVIALAALFVPDAQDRITLINEHIEPLLDHVAS